MRIVTEIYSQYKMSLENMENNPSILVCNNSAGGISGWSRITVGGIFVGSKAEQLFVRKKSSRYYK